jgi:hypothetical protein
MKIYISKSKKVSKQHLAQMVAKLLAIDPRHDITYYDPESHGSYGNVDRYINSSVELVILLCETHSYQIPCYMGKGQFSEAMAAGQYDTPTLVVGTHNKDACVYLDNMILGNANHKDWVHYVEMHARGNDEQPIDTTLDGLDQQQPVPPSEEYPRTLPPQKGGGMVDIPMLGILYLNISDNEELLLTLT